jgi:LacI family transcriptional regulator
MPNPAPTVRSLARELGLSRTTVSDALRGAPRVDPQTVQRVQEAARTAGYLRNPLAAALMSELRRSRGSTFRGVLAAVDLDEPDRPPYAARFHRELVIGASTRADELGFKVESFVLGGGGLSVQRLDSVLQSRGIHGVLLLPAWHEPDLSKLDWKRYSGVYTDYIIERPALHSVCTDHYRAMMGALSLLSAHGYRRPGLVLHQHNDERLQHRWSGAFRAFQATHPAVESVPPLMAVTPDRGEFVDWFRRTQPDVVLGHNTDIIDWMEACGARIPATHGFLSLNISMRLHPCAGLDLQPNLVGARGAELLVAQLQRNERDVPEWPTTTMIPARWVEGPTLRDQKVPPGGAGASEARPRSPMMHADFGNPLRKRAAKTKPLRISKSKMRN